MYAYRLYVPYLPAVLLLLCRARRYGQDSGKSLRTLACIFYQLLLGACLYYLSENPNLTVMYEGSTRFESTAQLVRLGLLHDTGAWANARATRPQVIE